MTGADLPIANGAVPIHSRRARSSPAPVRVPTPRPRARHAPLTSQPTAGAVTATPVPSAIAFQLLGFKNVRGPVEKSRGSCWETQLDLVTAIMFQALNLQRVEVLREMQRLLDLELGPRWDE